MIYVLSGGAGSGLNLKVVGGTVQPADPAENTIWLNTDTAVTNYAFSVDKPARISSNKNYLVYPYDSGASLTSAGVSYTCNSSGHVTANGTATATSYYRVYREPRLVLNPGTYTLSGCPTQPSGGNAYQIYVYDETAATVIARDYGSGNTFTLSKRTGVTLSIQVSSGKTATNAVFKPQLEKASSASSYVKGDATGMVWIKTAAASTTPLNVDKKNTVMIYPAAVQQYISGAWEKKDAQVYTNGNWYELAAGLRIIANGVYDDSITGGWVAGNKKFTSETGQYAPLNLTAAVETADTSLVFKLAGTDYKIYNGSVLSANDIDFTDLKQITFKGTANGVQNQIVALSVMDRNNTYTQTGALARAVAIESAEATSFDVTLDVSSITGSYALAIGLQVQNINTLIVEMSEFILE